MIPLFDPSNLYFSQTSLRQLVACTLIGAILLDGGGGQRRRLGRQICMHFASNGRHQVVRLEAVSHSYSRNKRESASTCCDGQEEILEDSDMKPPGTFPYGDG